MAEIVCSKQVSDFWNSTEFNGFELICFAMSNHYSQRVYKVRGWQFRIQTEYNLLQMRRGHLAVASRSRQFKGIKAEM